MKLYVIPNENYCNAKCSFCITKPRKLKSFFLKADDLKKALKRKKFEKIEITGGGEPGLAPNIKEIINLCAENNKTQVYTNGTLNPRGLPSEVLICLSRAHYDEKKNEEIMGLKYNINKYRSRRLKLSLLLHKSGISEATEILKYIKWAKQIGAEKVVIRQLFEPENEKYEEYYKREFVPTNGLFSNQKIFNKDINKTYLIEGIEVEVEERSCACENTDPILHANGKITTSWEEK